MHLPVAHWGASKCLPIDIQEAHTDITKHWTLMHIQSCGTKYIYKKHSDLLCHLRRSGNILSMFCPLSWVSDNNTNTEKHTRLVKTENFTLSKKNRN